MKAMYVLYVLVFVCALVVYLTNKLYMTPDNNTQNQTGAEHAPTVYELRSAKVDLGNKQIIYKYLDGEGHTTFIIPLVTDTGWQYAVIPFSWLVRPDARPTQGQAYIQHGEGKFFPTDAQLQYSPPTLKGVIKSGQSEIVVNGNSADFKVISEDNFDDIKKLSSFENFTINVVRN